MIDIERHAADALQRRAAVASPRHDLAAVEAEARAAGVVWLLPDSRRGPRRHSWVAPAGAVAAAVLLLVVVAVRRDTSVDQPVGTNPDPTTQPAVAWTMPHVSLSAQSVAVEYGGEAFTPVGTTSTARSSMLSGTEEIASVTWAQRGKQISWEIQFESNGEDWWVASMTLLDGQTRPAGDNLPAVHLDIDRVRSPLGSAFEGDLDVSGESQGTTARITITGLRIHGFLDRGAGGAYLTPTTHPGPAAMLVAAPPLPDDVPATGLTFTPEQWLLHLMAIDTLHRECMAAAGFVYPPPSDAVLVQAMGEWGPGPLQGIRRAGAARATGYHTENVGFLNGGEDFQDHFTDAEREAFSEALGGGGQTGGCYPEVEAQLPMFDGMKAWTVVGDLREQALADPRVIDALDAWGDCVEAAVGERAATPNELARRYAFVDGDPNDGAADEHEKQVAVADADCQHQADLERTFFVALTDRERVVMGDRVDEYDQWARELTAVLERSAQVLDERGIVLPSLD